MKSYALAILTLAAGFGPAVVRAEPMPPEWHAALRAWVAQVEKEVLALKDEEARLARFAAAWDERADYEARIRILDLTPRLRGRPLEKFLIARLGDEPNAAIRRMIARYMGELAAEAFRAPLETACKEDPVTFDFMGGCIATQGHARAEACEALEHLEEHMGDHVAPPGGGETEGWMGEPPPEGQPE